MAETHARQVIAFPYMEIWTVPLNEDLFYTQAGLHFPCLVE